MAVTVNSLRASLKSEALDGWALVEWDVCVGWQVGRDTAAGMCNVAMMNELKRGPTKVSRSATRVATW